MREQILLGSVSFDGVREKGGFGQPLHALYPQIRTVLANELGADAASLLAEPVVDRVHNRIDWYTEGDPDQPLVTLSDLSEEQRQPILAQVHALLDRGRDLAERYIVSSDSQRMQLGAILQAVLGTPADSEVFLVNDRPVIAHWSFSSDRPWVASDLSSVRGAIASPALLEAPDEIAIPDIAIPKGEESPPLPDSLSESSPPLDSPPPELPLQGYEEPPGIVLDKPASQQPEHSLEPEAPPLSTMASPSPVVENPDPALRYVVVGSRYFWSVAALALLLALGAVFWYMTRSSTPSPTDKVVSPLPDAAIDRALADARQAEQALRLQLGQRLAELAEQRHQCSSPIETGAGATPMLSAPSTSTASLTAPTPTDRSTTATATRESAVVSTALPTEPGVGDATRPDAAPPIADSRTITPVAAHPAAPATGDSPMQKPTTPVISKSLARALEEESNGSQPAITPPPAEKSGGSPPAITRVLEEELSSSPPAITPPLAESVNEPPVQAESTPEERQEFIKRLSATGAASGEITATLLWDGGADLDLVVRCPSGQLLDYLTPQGCGGTLDVDANATRNNLSQRPVENAFWPADKAAPGTYQIAVRYEPRKDERNPQPVPFQVRLIRNDQEQSFKGTIRPRKTVQIANFTVVER